MSAVLNRAGSGIGYKRNCRSRLCARKRRYAVKSDMKTCWTFCFNYGFNERSFVSEGTVHSYGRTHVCKSWMKFNVVKTHSSRVSLVSNVNHCGKAFTVASSSTSWDKGAAC